ncbi:hypothetical protein WR25_11343 [Diploscapter pachys]|uniref:Uncharacterized protein n=1 Tax=Diploscapter pachys TaxID=2018661 RepID=A0A2A2KLR6_9BILA|nr:hypothetical protein WR25_11343 [Diploscapter pachys]
MNRTAKLLVYEGFAEIKGYDLPKRNLIATITENGKVDNIELTSPLYTFVAIEGDVYYEIIDDGIYLTSKISADRNLMMMMIIFILNPINGCIIYLTVEYDNANVHIDMAENITYNRSINPHPFEETLKTFAGYGYNKYLPMDPVTSFTVYQKYIPQMFAQIYFYAPQIDFRYFLYNYGLALPNDLIFNIAFDQYNTVFSLARFLATVHFVNFQGTNQKRLNYVQLNRGATLLVYKGIPEIVGYDFPNKDLVAKIT